MMDTYIMISEKMDAMPRVAGGEWEQFQISSETYIRLFYDSQFCSP